MFRQQMCSKHDTNTKTSKFWNLYKECTFAHSEEEREFYIQKYKE